MKGAVNLRMMGRFGNLMFQYAFGRAYCEKHGFELRNDPWVGELLFDIPKARRITERFEHTHTEITLDREEGDIELLGYFQSQAALIYTRRQVREWFQWRRQIKGNLECIPPIEGIPAHRRVGDYIGYGYPVVSEQSYHAAAAKHGFNPSELVFVTEEHPFRHDAFPGELAFVPDFYRLMHSRTMFRGNSCFSWWAGTLSDGQTYSPVIDGLPGGKEHHVPFVTGNWPRLANHEFTTDLHLKP